MILQNPASATVQDNLRSIGEFVGFLKGRADEGFDLQRLLNACIKLLDVAAFAISNSQAEEHSHSTDVVSSQSHTSTQLDVSVINLDSQDHSQTEANNSHSVNPHQTASRERLAATGTGIPEQPALARG